MQTEHAEYTYDANGWLTGYCTHEGTGCQDQVSYEYDLVGNRTRQVDADGDTSYSYDDANQLLDAQHGDTTTLTNTWTADGAIDHSITAAGTRTQSTNLAGEVTEYVLPDGREVSYSYDPDGNRTARLVDATIDATWTWDTITGLATRTAQYDAAGSPSTQWLPDPMRGTGTAIAAVHGTSGHTWLLTDPFGNIQATTTDGTQPSRSNPFGASLENGAPTVAGLGFSGQYFDQVTKLYDMRARDYDASTGRFTATDPVTAPVGMPSLTGFTYAANTPLVFSDATGEWLDCEALFGLCDSPTFLWNEGVGFKDGAVATVDAIIHAPRTYHQTVDSCNAGFDRWSGGSGATLEGFLQCVDNLNPVAAVRDEFGTAISSSCVEESGQAVGRGLFGATLQAAPFAKGVGVPAAAASAAQSISPSLIRFSQSSVNGARAITESMARRGWVGDPIDAVRMPDGGLTTVDNTRLLAAHQAGIDVKAVVHSFDEPLPASMGERFASKKGVSATTWGEAVTNRIGNQSGSYRRAHPSGSPYTSWDGN